MGITFFSGNSKQTGGLMSVSFNSKTVDNNNNLVGAVFLNIVRQTGYDAQRKISSFKDGAQVGVKLSQEEVCSLIDTIRNRSTFNLYHSSSNGTVSGIFRYYNIEGQGNKPNKEGFGFTINKDNEETKIGLSLGGAERLAQYLEFALYHIFSAIYAEDKKRAEENSQNGQSSSRKQATKKTTRKTAQKQVAPPAEEEVVDESLEEGGGEEEMEETDVPF